MDTNTIFHIASTTKPITSVAVLMLCDDGLIQLDDPVSKYIPEFSKATVLARGRQRKDAIPAEQENTIFASSYTYLGSDISMGRRMRPDKKAEHGLISKLLSPPHIYTL